MMSESFDYFNAPQFFDFTKTAMDQENEHGDDYFDLDHENSVDPLGDGNHLKDTSVTNDDVENNKYFRRSMSVNDLNCLKDALESAETEKNLRKQFVQTNENVSKTNMKKFGSFSSLNEQDQRSSEIKNHSTRSISRESVNRLAQPKQHFSSDQNLNKNSYLPMAEALKKFQNTTPERFRTKPKQNSFVRGNVSCKLTTTIPHTPNLKTTTRARPVEALSREEQEKIEFEEAQKFKIKANPVNKKILQGPMKPTVPVQKKPSTIPEPFKLTAPPKKVPEPPKRNSFEFHANPVPKAVHEPPKIKANLRTNFTNPQTPTFMKRYSKFNETAKPVQPEVEPKQQQAKPRNTKPLPFSFEMRDLYAKSKRQELIQKVLEEEKKAREFHARPIPKSVTQPLKNRSLIRHGSHPNLNSNSINKSNENLPKEFKARPATVLTKNPFIPKKI
nr:targeting protein for Xklp2-like [Leptinotarsa decemlineata]